MNPAPPPLPHSKPPGPFSLQRYGCLVILVVVVALIVLAVFALRYAIFETAVPFRTVAALIEKGSPNMKISGVGGDLATGPSVASITWGVDPAHRSEILDLRVKYNGLADARKNRRVVIEDVGVRKAHIDLTDMEGFVTASRSGSRPVREPRDSKEGSGFPPDLDSIEVRRVLIEDVLFTNRKSGFRLSIPKVAWTGFKATPQGVEAGELHVESDRLSLHTGPGRTHALGSESVTFEKSLNGVLQPLLHPAIRQPLAFSVDFTFIPEVRAPAFHFSGLDNRVELATTADGGHGLKVRHLDLPTLLDAKKLYGADAAEFPSDLVLEAVTEPEEGPLRVLGGSFRLGVATFQIVPSEIPRNDQENAALQAVLPIDGGEIRWSLPLREFPIHFRPRLTATPELPPTEILARVFTGRSYSKLDADEKRSSDARVPAYFAPLTP
jgi:hypothetical protein